MKDNKVQLNSTKYKFSSDWIHGLETEQHWAFYWCQQKLMDGLIEKEDTILEIGVGSSFTANYLRSKGYNVTTIDIDPGKKPDIVANVVTYEFENKYDHVLAFEILEHIPYEEFRALLRKLRTIINKNLFFSIPRNELVLFEMIIGLPMYRNKKLKISISKGKITTEAHHWEIGCCGVTEKKVLDEFKSNGFQDILRTFKKDYINFYAIK